MSTDFVEIVLDLYIDYAKVGPQLKGHVKHVHLGTRSARVERQKCSDRFSLHSCHCNRVRIRKSLNLVENDHHVANVVAVRV